MKLVKLTLATTAMTVGAGLAMAEEMAMSNEMTIVSWGGAYQESQLKAYVEPYLEMHPEVNVTWDESSAEAVAKLRAMNEANDITWDLVDVTISDSMRLCDEGLAATIDFDNDLAAAPDGTSAADDFGQTTNNECFVPQIVYSTTWGYRTDMVGDTPPTEICDIFDLETYPGKRSMQKRPIDNVEWALYCDGVAKEDIYDVLSTDEGVQQAFDKLATIKDNIVWWEAGADTPQLLADGEVVMGSTFNGRLFNAIVEEGQPIGMMWDMQSYDIDGWIVPEGLDDERRARVMDFLKFATDTQRLADQAKYISYGPARASSAPLVEADMAPYMPTDPANAGNVLIYDYTWWADNRDDIDAKFQSWLVQ